MASSLCPENEATGILQSPLATMVTVKRFKMRERGSIECYDRRGSRDPMNYFDRWAAPWLIEFAERGVRERFVIKVRKGRQPLNSQNHRPS